MATINPVFAIRAQVETAIKQALMQRRQWSVNPHIARDVYKVFA
jgi:hypothetical protein